MHSDGKKTLTKRLMRGKLARQAFVQSHINKGLAFQIRALRDRLGWSQSELAKAVGMAQNAICRLENPDYGKHTITTLKRLAAAFDVGLVVRFVPFSSIIDWTTSTPRIDLGLRPDSLGVPSFEDELKSGIFDCDPARDGANGTGRVLQSFPRSTASTSTSVSIPADLPPQRMPMQIAASSKAMVVVKSN